MQRTILLFVLIFGMSCHALALDKQALTDTLNALVRQHAYTESVKVHSVRVKNKFVTVRTNRALSTISLSANDVRDLRLLVSQMVLGNNQGKVTIYTDDYEIGELVTSVHQSRSKANRYTLPTTTPWVTNTSRP